MAKILIVDDEPHIRILLSQALEDLEDEGAELLEASQGDEALKSMLDHKPDLVFLDVMMPVYNGFEVCQMARKSGLVHTKIVILSAKGQEFDKKTGEDVGADLYLTKPFNPLEIQELARNLLNL